MATGGIFQLITNDGKQDRMLMASALLKKRIDTARKARIARGDSDPTPTLYDIERTHILFTNAHFKPFAAIGYEYNKVTNSAGSTTLASTITFSIPQFGDFFNDMVVHAVLTQPTLSKKDASDQDVDPSDQNLFRWCAYPGERLLKKVKFEVNGNPLDEYTSDSTNFHREFLVQPNKEVAWGRCVGQEEPEPGFLDQPNWPDSGVAADDIAYRTAVTTTSGNQTPTGVKTSNLELFIPLLFWCNRDPRLAVPSVAIPYGQRFITVELASAAELVGEVGRGANDGAWDEPSRAAGGSLSTATLSKIELYINNIFVNPEVHNIFIKRIGFTLIRVHRQQTHDSSGGEETVLLQNLKWPIEALFVGMRVKQYHNGNPSQTREHLDKWHTFSTVASTPRETQGWTSGKQTLAGSYNDGVALADAGGSITALATVTGSNLVEAGIANTLTDLFSPGDVLTYTSGGNTYSHTINSVDDATSQLVLNEPAGDNTNLIVGGTTDITIVRTVATAQTSTVDVCERTLTSVTIKAHGIPIYNDFPAGFYNAYLPYNYGGHNIRAPKDCGALLITFCLYIGTYQPSGHINVSRAREFYISYTTSDKITSDQKGTLVVVASAINFLLISDGSAVLRYST